MDPLRLRLSPVIPSLTLLLVVLPSLILPTGAWLGPDLGLPQAGLHGGVVPLYPVYPVDPLGAPEEGPCGSLLEEFARRSAELVLCSLLHARPLRLCRSCFLQQWSANRTYGHILNAVQADNATCETRLLRSDRLQLLFQQHVFAQGLWDAASCEACLVTGTNGTREAAPWMSSFLRQLNETHTCFDSHSREPQYELEGVGVYPSVCNKCRTAYNTLGAMFSALQTNGSSCIDLEDAMNVTRQLWSAHFRCVEYYRDTPSVLAVSVFMCMLPVFFYLSSVLHSRQRKRRLVTPKRTKSTNSLGGLQRPAPQ